MPWALYGLFVVGLLLFWLSCFSLLSFILLSWLLVFSLMVGFETLVVLSWWLLCCASGVGLCWWLFLLSCWLHLAISVCVCGLICGCF